MKEIHFAVVPNRSAKQQALEVIKKLEGHIPIARAKMKIQISTPASAVAAIKAGLLKESADIVEESRSETTARLVVLIAPGSFRVVNALVQEHAAGKQLDVCSTEVRTASDNRDRGGDARGD